MKFSGIRVAVLRGGPSSRYDDSLKTGEHVLSALRELSEYQPIDIFISKDGDWHRDGLAQEPHEALRHTDLVWNALHGSYGADGEVQQILEGLKIPFTGSGTVATVLAGNRDMSRNLYKNHSLRAPAHEIFTEDDLNGDKVVEIFRNYMHPVVVRPAASHSPLKAQLVHSFNDLKDAIRETLRRSQRVLVEEGVRGEEVICTVLEGARDEKIYAFEPTRLGENQSKKLTKPTLKTIEEMAKKAHEVLGLRHYSSSHFLVSPKGRVYIIETDSHPHFGKDSHLNQTLGKAGWRHHDFVNHVIKLTL